MTVEGLIAPGLLRLGHLQATSAPPVPPTGVLADLVDQGSEGGHGVVQALARERAHGRHRPHHAVRLAQTQTHGHLLGCAGVNLVLREREGR